MLGDGAEEREEAVAEGESGESGAMEVELSGGDAGEPRLQTTRKRTRQSVRPKKKQPNVLRQEESSDDEPDVPILKRRNLGRVSVA